MSPILFPNIVVFNKTLIFLSETYSYYTIQTVFPHLYHCNIIWADSNNNCNLNKNFCFSKKRIIRLCQVLVDLFIHGFLNYRPIPDVSKSTVQQINNTLRANGAINQCNIFRLSKYNFYIKFQFNMPKVTKVMAARGMMGQKGLERQNTLVRKFVV